MRATLVLSIALAVVPALRAAEEPLSTRAFDVSALLDPGRESGLLGLDLSGATTWVSEETAAPPLDPFLSDTALVGLLISFAAPSMWEIDGYSLDIDKGLLTAKADPATLDAVGGVLAALWAEASRRVTVEAEAAYLSAESRERLEASGTLAALLAGRLDAAGRAAVLAEAAKGGNLITAGTAVARPGRLAEIRQTTSTSYVSDVSVEIAQGSVVGDPVVAFVHEGWVLGVRPTLLLDGTVLLEALHQTASLEGPIRRVSLEADPFGTVDLPALSVDRLSLAARARPGETIAAVRASPGGKHPLAVLLLTPSVAGGPDQPGPIEYLPATALLRGRTAVFPRTPTEEDEGAMWGEVQWRELLFAPRLLLDRRAAFVADPAELLADRPGGSCLPEGGGLFLPAGDPAGPRLRETIRSLEARAAGTRRVHLTLAEWIEGGPAKVLSAWHLTVPLSAEAMFEAGTERRFVGDWEVEVAQEARTGDPVVMTAFGGVYGALRLDASPDGSALAGVVSLVLADLDPAIDTRRPGMEKIGIIEVPKASHATLRREFVLAPGGKVTIDAGRTPGGPRVTLTVAVEEDR